MAFERHKGYGTKSAPGGHIAQHGVIDQHRRSFRPVRIVLALDEPAGYASIDGDAGCHADHRLIVIGESICNGLGCGG